jgi:hypothetical protein
VIFVVKSFPRLQYSKTLNYLLVPNNTVDNSSKVSIKTVLIWSVVVPSLMLITRWLV